VIDRHALHGVLGAARAGRPRVGRARSKPAAVRLGYLSTGTQLTIPQAILLGAGEAIQ